MEWFRRHKIDVMQWPALSPDLNPIENSWGILSRAVYDNGRLQFNATAELRAAIERKWNAIELGTLETLVVSMPERIYDVISGGGSSTSY